MPAYFCMEVQLKTRRLTHNYVEQLYSTIIQADYKFKSGFWFHEDATYDEIITWNQAKLEQGFRLGSTQHVRNNYIHMVFDAAQYQEMRGYWMYSGSQISFHLIIPEHDILNYEGGDTVLESKVAPIRALGVKIWEAGLADVIQTSVEMDDCCYSINEVLSGENLLIHPFAIIPKNTGAKFHEDYFEGKELVHIQNDGVLINSHNKLDNFMSRRP